MRVISAAIFLYLLFPLASWGIDKGDLKELDPAKANQVFDSIMAEVYYVKNARGGAQVAGFDEQRAQSKQPLAMREPLHFAVILYLNKDAAEQTAKEQSQQFNQTMKVKVSNLHLILKKQYTMLDKPLSTSFNNPDMVVFEDLSQAWVYPEYLMNDKTKEPYSTTIAGKKLVPAFFSREEAIAYQKKITTADQTYTRVGSDFRSFLKFIEERLETDAPVKLFGYQSEKLMAVLEQKG